MSVEKEFIPFEEALALEELGFDSKCLGFYDAYNGNSHLLLNDRYKPIWLLKTWQRIFCKQYQDTTFVSQSYVEYINGVCLAPLYQQAFRFFRDNYNLNIQIYPSLKGVKSYNYDVFETEKFITLKISTDTYTSYQEAELACLKKVIEIAKDEVPSKK